MGFVFFGGLLMAWEVRSISSIIFEQQVSIQNLIPLLLTTIPWNVGLILPMTAVLGGLLGTQQLSEASEMVASQGLGCGMREFLKPWALLSIILMVCSVINAHWISPWASRKERQLFYDLAQESVLVDGYMPKPGEEPKLLKGNVFSQNTDTEQKKSSALSAQTIYLGISKGDNKLHIMQVGSELISHLVSDRYSYKIEMVKLKSHEAFDHMQLRFRFEDVNGKATTKDLGLNGRMTDLSYKVFELNQPIQIKKGGFYQPTAARHMSTNELLLAAKSGDSGIKGVVGVELSRRFSNPLACCALLLLGISIGLNHPRFYKGGGLVKSIALILFYFIVVKAVEGLIENNTINWLYISILLPFYFLLGGWILLYKKMYPSQHGSHRNVTYWFRIWWQAFVSLVKKIWEFIIQTSNSANFVKRYQTRFNHKLIGRWTSKRWWANFAGTLSIFMTFHIFMEFAGLAQFIAKRNDSLLLFIKYWICNLPVTLPFILPVVFLLAWVLTFSDASVSREWTALRAGGVSLIQWVRSSWKAWGLALFAIFAMEAYLSPKAFAFQDRYYWQIKGKDDNTAKNSATTDNKFPNTLFLSHTGIFWHTEGPVRWGFPLLSLPDAPSLVFWKHGESYTQQLNWNSNKWTQGISAETIFPASSLRDYQKTDEIPTLDLFVWQTWAPNAARGTILWGRLFKWLIGPCLFFAALGFVFPSPRKGRGQALGYALILSLVFMWMQNIFEGASKSGQFPPFWGIFAPMVILIGFGLINLRNLRT
jgi:lipopolysaccharide export LptBFGC system permease protein LptF